jgi:plasmid stabilization system protein ParE
MRCSVVFSSTAAKELQESFDWYENRADGLGYQFIETIDNVIELILLNPEVFPNKKAPYREATTKKFPFLIVYEYVKEKQTIYVLHIFHTKRHPRTKYKQK